MIVKNEQDYIERCIRSVTNVVDKIIVVDTGSTDKTVQLATQLGAEVSHFEWCDDFSAARNMALSRSDADWNLVIDADEWLNDNGNRFYSVVLPQLNQGLFLGEICQNNAYEIAGDISYSPLWIPRVLPRGIKYDGRIHEQPMGMLPRKRLEITFEHSGYLPIKHREKQGRNERLLLESLQLNPQDCYLWYQLGKEYNIYGQHENAVLAFERGLRLGDASYRFWHDLVIRFMNSLKHTSRYSRAIELADDYLQRWDSSPDLWFCLGDIFLSVAQQNPNEALSRWLPMVCNCWQKCLSIGENLAFDGAVSGRGSFLAAHNLAIVYESLGDSQNAQRYQELKRSFLLRS